MERESMEWLSSVVEFGIGAVAVGVFGLVCYAVAIMLGAALPVIIAAMFFGDFGCGE
jgi:hypothetical protein